MREKPLILPQRSLAARRAPDGTLVLTPEWRLVAVGGAIVPAAPHRSRYRRLRAALARFARLGAA